MDLEVGGQTIKVLDIQGPTPTYPPDDRFDAVIAPYRSQSVTFDLNMSGAGPSWLGAGEKIRDVTISMPYRPAWWIRLADRMQHRPERTYQAVTFTAKVDRTQVGYGKDEITMSADLIPTSPITFASPPMSRAERLWHRLCAPTDWLWDRLAEWSCAT